MALLSGAKDFFGFDHYHKRDMLDRLNLLGAVEAHVLWKTRLGHHVRGDIREPLEFALVGQDGVCQLGNLINDPVFQPFHGSDVYQRLSEAHRQFHESGTAIIENLKEGDRSGADAIFRNEYSLALRNIIESLTGISRLLQEN